MGIFFDLGRKKQSLKVSHLDADCRIRASRHLAGVFQEIRPERDIIFFCIGTDRSTGDSLGPLVGTQLIKKNLPAERVYGTLDRPVHAINLDETLSEAVLRHRDPFVVAVDACLGQLSSVGCIQIAGGPVKPGAGVHKELPPVGDIHITGIVNVSGFMEYFVLQNTRLNQVMKMSEKISDSIFMALRQCGRMESGSPTRVTDGNEQFL